MKRTLIYLSLLATVFVMPALAENNTVINVHIDKAVAIPGNVLAPGDYVFRMSDPARTLVSISSADSKTFYGFVPVFSTARTSTSGSEIRETAPDTTGLARIDSWFFPGEKSGFRFIYSQDDIQKADTIAKRLKSDGSRSGM